MRELLSLQLRLVPDLLEVMQKRLEILRKIQLQEPVGRRSLAHALNTTERILRSEVDFLKEQGLVHVESIGMFITENGKNVLESLETVMKDVYGISDLELELQKKLGLKRVIVVPGESEEMEQDKKELGRIAAQHLLSILREDDIVAVTGGTTLAAMAEMMQSGKQYPQVLFVPARGGLGENIETQASQVAAECAKKAGAGYRMFHLPDNLGSAAFQSLREDPYVQEMLGLIRSASIVVHGIGRAMEMAVRRNASREVLQQLKNGEAVGEAFGYYFDRKGQIIHQMETMGLRLDNVQEARYVMGIAGGKQKAEAIIGIANAGFLDVLIMDESAAEGVSLLVK